MIYKLYYSVVNKYNFKNDLKLDGQLFIEFMEQKAKVVFAYGYGNAKNARYGRLEEYLRELGYAVEATEDPMSRFLDGSSIVFMPTPTERLITTEDCSALDSHLKQYGKLLFICSPKSWDEYEKFLESNGNAGRFGARGFVESFFGRPIIYAHDTIYPEVDFKYEATISGFWNKKVVDIADINIPLNALRRWPVVEFFAHSISPSRLEQPWEPYKPLWTDIRQLLLPSENAGYESVYEIENDYSIEKGMAWFKSTNWPAHMVDRFLIKREIIRDDVDYDKMIGIICKKYGLTTIGWDKKEIKDSIFWGLRNRTEFVGIFSFDTNSAIGICADVFADEYMGREIKADAYGTRCETYGNNVRFARRLFDYISHRPAIVVVDEKTQKAGEDARRVAETIAAKEEAKPEKVEAKRKRLSPYPYKMPA